MSAVKWIRGERGGGGRGLGEGVGGKERDRGHLTGLSGSLSEVGAKIEDFIRF